MVDREKGALGLPSANPATRSRRRLVRKKIHPRLNINSIDAETADVIDFCLGETTLGVSAQLMQAPVTALTAFGALCSGLIDYGYTDWHRDASSAEQAPLSGMQADLMAQRPRIRAVEHRPL